MAADANGQVTPYPKQYSAPKAKRRGVKPISDKRAATFDVRAAIRNQAFERDGGCLLAHHRQCYGKPLTYHHRRKESQGGRFTLLNGMTLCSGCNCRLEADADFADWAQRHGVVLKAGDDPDFQLTGCPRSCGIDHRPTAGASGANPPERTPNDGR